MKSKILITDELPPVAVVDEYFDAAAKKAAREQTLTKWFLGHAVDVVHDNNSEWITMTVGEQHFSDRRSEYPSEKLVANLTLAIYAGEGLSPSKFEIQDLDDETVREVLERGVSSWAAARSAYRGVDDETVREVLERGVSSWAAARSAYRGGNQP